MASASERTEEEARKLFEDGVNPDFPLTAKIHNKYGPVVSDVRKSLPNGSQQIVGYQTRFKFYPRGQLHAASAAGYSRGAKAPILMCLKRYPTEAEADARKYRDVIAYYIESRSRPPKTQTLTEQQQQARADREAARNSRNRSDDEVAEAARQIDQTAVAAVGHAMHVQVKRKASMRDSTTAQSPAARAQAQRELDQQQLKVARTEVEARKETQNNNKLKRHRDIVENLKAMATAEITAIDDRVEVLVAAHDQLLLKLVYDGTPPAADGTPPVVPATAGGTLQAASGTPPAVPVVIAVEPAVIFVVDGEDDTPAAHDASTTRAATAAAAAAAATAATAAAAAAINATAAATAAVEKRRADLWAELSFAALTDHQVDKLYALLEVVMVVCRHFKEAWTAFSRQAATKQVDEHIIAPYPTSTLMQALTRTVAGWRTEAARFRTHICPCYNTMCGWYTNWVEHGEHECA
jgi:flagellin-specific chaperone FliS